MTVTGTGQGTGGAGVTDGDRPVEEHEPEEYGPEQYASDEEYGTFQPVDLEPVEECVSADGVSAVEGDSAVERDSAVEGDGPASVTMPAAGDGVVPTVAGAPGAVHPRVWQRRVTVLRDQGRRRLRWVVAAVAVLLALVVALLALHTPLVAVRHTTVVGASHTGTAAVLEAAGLTGNPPLIDVNPTAAATRVEALPWVAHAVVARHWPDAVTVTVTERVPLGALARPGGGVALVDRTGRVLAWEADAPGLVLSLPVPPGRPGSVLPRVDRPALAVGVALTGPLAGRVSDVGVAADGSVTLDLGRGLTALLGPPNDIPAKLAALASVLDEAHPRGPAQIDLTIPDQPTVGPPPVAPTAGAKGR